MNELTDIFLTVFNLSISAGWIVVAVVILRAVLKKAPKWINCVWWLVVAVRLVFPFSVESVFSLIPSAQVVTSDIVYAASPSVSTGFPALNSVINPAISAAFSPEVSDSVNPMQVVLTVGSWVWIFGMLAMLIYALCGYLALKAKMKTAVKLEDNIFQSENVFSPFILGIFKPKIYLPFGIDENSAVYVISHEKAHIKRKDHLIKPFAFLLLSVYWFNPLMWVAYILLCRDIELACDESAVKNLPKEQRQKYSLVLLESSAHRRMVAACPLAFGEVGVKQRIKSVMNYKKPAFWIIVVAVISCVVTSVCFLTNPVSREESHDNIEPIAELSPDEKLDIAIREAIRSNSPVFFGKQPSFATESYEILGYDDEIDKKASRVIGETVAIFFHNNFYVYEDGQITESTEANRAIISFDIAGENGKYKLKQYSEFVKGSDSFDAEFSEMVTVDADYEEIGYALSEECRKQAVEYFGVAQWRYAPMLSASFHYFCPITFSMEYDRVELQCSDGQLVKEKLKEGQEYARAMSCEGEERVSWTPAREGDGNGEAESAEICFQIIKGGREIYGGIIYATAQENFDDRHARIYIFDMYETGELILRQNSTGPVIRLGEKANEISFYSEALDEDVCFNRNTDNRVVAKVYLSNRAVKTMGKLIKNSKKTDDRYANRTRYYFDGKFTLDDGKTYYFCDEHNVICYDHYIVSVSDEEMRYIMSLQEARTYRSAIDGSLYATLTLHCDIPFFEFSPHPLSSKIYYGMYDESNGRIIAKDQEGGEEFVFKKSRGRLIFDKAKSFQLPQYNKNESLKDGALFVQ